jgi:3-phosphoshikimate 1-carboxyvinyltransferase
MREKEPLMDLTIRASNNLSGSITIPSNKSHSFRALIMASLARGESVIRNPAISNDWRLGVAAMRQFGATVADTGDGVWRVTGVAGKPKTPDAEIDCGNSGILLRFLAAVATKCEGEVTLTGDHSLQHIRLCQPVLDAINDLGGSAVSTKGDGHAPIIVRGPITGGTIRMPGLDSQPVSAAIIAGCLSDVDSEIIVDDPGEMPWVGMTLEWLARCGATVSHDDYRHYRVSGGTAWKSFDVTIPLDWSAALYPVVAAVVCPGSEVFIPGVDFGDCQGDRLVLNVLKEMGADIDIRDDGVVARYSRLKGIPIDCNEFVDQFMLLAVVGACAEGKTVLTGAEVCRHKECDRIEAMAESLREMGVSVEVLPDGMIVNGGGLRGAVLPSRHDHRIVMSMTCAGLAAMGETTITDIGCVEKTFPDFVSEMLSLGCDLQTTGA